jgi:hypothetical protein
MAEEKAVPNMTIAVCAQVLEISNRQFDKLYKRVVIHKFNSEYLATHLRALDALKNTLTELCDSLAKSSLEDEQRIQKQRLTFLERAKKKQEEGTTPANGSEGGETPLPAGAAKRGRKRKR